MCIICIYSVFLVRLSFLYYSSALRGLNLTVYGRLTLCNHFPSSFIVRSRFESYTFSGPCWASHPVQPFPHIIYFCHFSWPLLGVYFLPLFLFFGEVVVDAESFIFVISKVLQSFEQFHLFISVFHYYFESYGLLFCITFIPVCMFFT